MFDTERVILLLLRGEADRGKSLKNHSLKPPAHVHKNPAHYVA